MLNELIIPASSLEVVKQYAGSSDQLGYLLKSQAWDIAHLPRIAILGLPEGRGSRCQQVAEAPDAIRQHLYTLATFPSDINIVDLGNIKAGNELKDTHAAVKIVAEELSALNIHLLIIGGSQEMTVPLISGIDQQELNLVIVDDRIDNSVKENSPADEFYINNLPVSTSVSVMAGQSYFICQQEHDIVAEGYNGEILTLGEIRGDF